MSEAGIEDEARRDKIRDLIGTGAEIAGGAVGGALGMFATGPVGGAALGAGGVAIARALTRIGNEVSNRLLGQREKVRIGAVLALIAVEVRTRLDQGETVRNDGFFADTESGRSDAEEVAENVLLKSQREAEERKLPYMANLFSSVVFDHSISAGMAHQLVKTAEQLTYRQMCLLKVAAMTQRLNLRAETYEHYGPIDIHLRQLLYECYDLYQRGLINNGQHIAFGPAEINPRGMTTQGLGADLFNCMQLGRISDAEIELIAAQLR